MEKYYKLNLEGSVFWHSSIVDGKKVFTQEEFIAKRDTELNTIYLKKLSDNIYIEVCSNKFIKLDENNSFGFSYPKGVIIDTHKITPSSLKEVYRTYRSITEKKLDKEYIEIVNNIMMYSNICELAKEKKEETKRKQSILDLIK